MTQVNAAICQGLDIDCSDFGGTKSVLKDINLLCNVSTAKDQLDVNSLKLARMKVLLHGGNVYDEYCPDITHTFVSNEECSHEFQGTIGLQGIQELIDSRTVS